MKAVLRGLVATLFGSLTMLSASLAFADGEACYNDIDCPGTACGDAVCNWTKTAAAPMGMKAFACNPAGSQTPVGNDGWCTTDADCKCLGMGAKCQQPTKPYCTFTKPSEAPAGSGGTGAGGSGTAGTGTTTAGTGTSTAGTGTSAAGTGTTPAKEDSGGCSVGGAENSGVPTMALVLGALGLGVTLSRRRR